MSCLPCKEEIDNGMGRLAAKFYADIASGTTPTVAAAEFYARGVEQIFSPLAQKFLTDKTVKLTAEQTEALMAQIDKQCYRADDLLSWGLAYAGSSPETTTRWTAKLLGWAKDDQVFYTNLSAELKG